MDGVSLRQYIVRIIWFKVTNCISTVKNSTEFQFKIVWEQRYYSNDKYRGSNDMYSGVRGHYYPLYMVQ